MVTFARAIPDSITEQRTIHINHFLTSGVLALGLTVAACGTGQTETDAEALDEQLLGEADNSDPALTAALEDQIMVDPDLTNQSNQNAALPGDAVSGAPVPDTMSGRQYAAREAISESRLLSAPVARQAAEEDCNSCGQSAGRGETTLGAMAASQASEGQNCANADVDYGFGWAERMPSAFTAYPRSEIIEAAGNDDPGCRMRVVSFRTIADMQRMIDWYYTRAMRAGYSSEHLLRHGNHVLGGYRERDKGAYYIVFAERPGGGTDIDIVTNNGR